MKVKPKEVLLNLPVALLFDEPWEISSFAASINSILHGKVRLKLEDLGTLGGRHVGLFYLQRDFESQMIHDEFVRLIEEEEVAGRALPPFDEDKDEDTHAREEDKYAHALCDDRDEYMMLHLKGEEHCRCGGGWTNGKCEVLNES